MTLALASMASSAFRGARLVRHQTAALTSPPRDIKVAMLHLNRLSASLLSPRISNTDSSGICHPALAINPLSAI